MRESIGKIALIGLLLFFCTSFVALANISYHPKNSGINWEYRSDPSYPASNDFVIVSTTPRDGDTLSGTYPVVITYKHGSGIAEWRFDDSRWFNMLYYGQGRDGIQEAQGIFDTTPFEGKHTITFRVWLLNGSKMERSVNIVISS